jgi:hypothetical protein
MDQMVCYLFLPAIVALLLVSLGNEWSILGNIPQTGSSLPLSGAGIVISAEWNQSSPEIQLAIKLVTPEQ